MMKKSSKIKILTLCVLFFFCGLVLAIFSGFVTNPIVKWILGCTISLLGIVTLSEKNKISSTLGILLLGGGIGLILFAEDIKGLLTFFGWAGMLGSGGIGVYTWLQPHTY